MVRSVTLVITAAAVAAMVAAAAAVQQQFNNDPFPPIDTAKDAITVNFVEFATIPDAGGLAPRMMHFEDEAGTRRIFVSTMRGPIYSVSYDGKTVTEYLDVNATAWGIGVQSQGSERGLQSFAFHPQFTSKGTPGYGKFYVYTDTTDITPKPDFPSPGPNRTHDTVLLEWTAKDPAAATYDGGPPRVLLRVAQPFSNHNGGQIGFNPLATAGSPEFGLLWVGSADGGSGGDPFNSAQSLASVFGKILRIDPLGKNSANGQYGIPGSNPFVKNAKPDTLGEIYALGVRNPQRFSWDSKTRLMYVADIGQNTIEEISPVTAGSNLGWNKWEGSYLYGRGGVDMSNPRGEPGMTWPVAEFDHRDPLFNRAAITGVYIYRGTAIKQLQHLMLFGDNPSGEIFYVDADNLPKDPQAAMAVRRILLNDKGTPKTLLQLIKDKNAEQGKPPATRADLRLGVGPQGQIFVMNKRDGVIRLLVPDAPAR
jgi:glucose/sorbosone dehydrogenase